MTKINVNDDDDGDSGTEPGPREVAHLAKVAHLASILVPFPMAAPSCRRADDLVVTSWRCEVMTPPGALVPEFRPCLQVFMSSGERRGNGTSSQRNAFYFSRMDEAMN